MIINQLVPQASTYAEDIDFVWEFIFWLVGFWTVACFAVFFYFIFKFRAKDGVKAQYITGETKEQKKFVSVPHALVLICDVFVIALAVQVWYEVKQDIPEDPNTVEIRVMAQQWAWTFTHPGKDGKLDTPDDIKTTDELYVQNDQMYVYHLESRDVMHDFSVPVFRLKQDAIPGRVITGWFKTNNHEPPKNEDRKGDTVRYPMRRNVRNRPRYYGGPNLHSGQTSAHELDRQSAGDGRCEQARAERRHTAECRIG